MNEATKPDGLFFAVIDSRCDCEVCREWMDNFSCDHAPIIDPRPHLARVADGVIARFVMVDVASLTEGQIARSCESMGRAFGIDPARVRAEMLGEHGYPIRSESRAICTDVEQARRIIRLGPVKCGFSRMIHP